jgi:[acyl-carrier-protein] S-malonyltransferase
VSAACTAAAGLSLGEYTALAFAGALTFEDGLQLVAERGAAMQAAAQAAPSGMVSVLGLEVPQIETLCDEARQGELQQVANLLCPGNTVCSGSKSACERLTAAAEAAGAMRVIPLAVAGAFHTTLMAPASDRLRAKLAATPLQAPRIPVVSNVDAQPHTDPAEIRELLVKQLVSPVLWERCVRTLHGEMGIKTFYEIGPGKVLKGLMKRIDRSISCENVTA